MSSDPIDKENARSPTADEAAAARPEIERASEGVDEDLTGLIDHLTMWVDHTLALNTVTGEEREELASYRHQLITSVNWIRRFRGDDKHLKRIITFALDAAFHIGKDALRSPIVERIRIEKTRTSTKHARQSKGKKSQAIDATILELAEPLLAKGKSKRWIAHKIIDDVKRRHPRLTTEGAIDKRLRKLVKRRVC